MPLIFLFLKHAGKNLEAVFTSPFVRYGIATGLIVYVGFGAAFLRLDSTTADYWQHVSAIRDFATSLTAPGPLDMVGEKYVHLYTPYHFLWGALGRVTGLSMFNIAVLASVVNIGLLIFGCRQVAHYLIGDRRYESLVLMTFLFFWGEPTWFSGVYSFNQLPVQAVYPSWFVFAVSLIVISVVFEESHRSYRIYVAIALLIGLLFLIHPPTTSFLLLALLIKATVFRRLFNGETIVFGFMVLASLAAAALWPYYFYPDLVLRARQGAGFHGGARHLYENTLGRLGLALLGLLSILWLGANRRINFLVFGLATTAVVYSLNYVVPLSAILGRYLIYSAFFLHLLLVYGLKNIEVRFLRPTIWLGFAIVLGLSAFQQAKLSVLRFTSPYYDIVAGVALGSHSIRQAYADWAAMAPLVRRNAVAMVEPKDSFLAITFADLTVVLITHLVPPIDDYDIRAAAIREFFDPLTSSERRDNILRTYDVSYVIVDKKKHSLDVILELNVDTLYDGERYVLLRVW